VVCGNGKNEASMGFFLLTEGKKREKRLLLYYIKQQGTSYRV